MSTIHSSQWRRGFISVDARPTHAERTPMTECSPKITPQYGLTAEEQSRYGEMVAMALSRERMIFNGTAWQPNFEAAENVIAMARQEWEEREATKQRDPLELTIAELGLSLRTINALERENILYVRQLAGMTRQQLLSVPLIRHAGVREICSALRRLGVRGEK